MKHSSLLKIILCLFLLSSCNQIEDVEFNSGLEEPNSQQSNAESTIFAFLTDFQSSGLIYQFSYQDGEISAQNSQLSSLGSSGVIRSAADTLFFLADGYSIVSSDNFTQINPTNNFSITSQYSTGNGTNPKDILFADGDIFISLYNPPSDSNGKNTHVTQINPATGEIINTYSFDDFITVETDFKIFPDALLVANQKLYVALQSFKSDFSAAGTSYIGVINLETMETEGVIALVGRNPFKLALSNLKNKLFVANLATFNSEIGDFDLEAPYGGIETIDLATNSTESFVHDNNFSGYIENIKTHDSDVFIVVSSSDLSTFTFSSKVVKLAQNQLDGSSQTLLNVNDDIQDMVIDNNFLWISAGAGGSSAPYLYLINLDADTETPLSFELPVPALSLTQ